MKTLVPLVRFTIYLLLAGPVATSHAGFSSLYIFGDGASTTTHNTNGGSLYHGARYSNGRVWVEVLAQWQGITYEPSKNLSFFGHYSPNVISNINNFTPPPDASNSLFVLWVNNADFVSYMQDPDYAPPFNSTKLTLWTNSMNQSLSNHFKAITNLYHAKGVRTLLAPNAVDITKVPAYAGYSATNKFFVRQRVLSYNSNFNKLLNDVVTNRPDLTIYKANIFTLLDNVVSNAPAYGLTNATAAGVMVGALGDPALSPWSLTGPGTNYIFWDQWHPTAKFHMHIADLVQKTISPVRVSSISVAAGMAQVQGQNIPIGRNGVVEGSTNFATWTSAQSFSSTNANQVIPVSAPQEFRFYRLSFPFVWTWP